MTDASTISPHHLLDRFEVEAAALSRIGADQLALEIPHLDGWTVRSVVGHTGWVLRYAKRCLEADPDTPPSRSSVPEPPPGDDVLGWYATGRDEILPTLAAIPTNGDAGRRHPTFTGPQPAQWWLRRLSHEVSMHRWDVQAASARPAPIDADQARDGVDEVLQVFTPHRMQFGSLAGNGETVHLHATDIEHGEWLLTYRPDAVEWERAHAKGDVAARGPISDLLLFLWGRIPHGRLEVFGDASLLDRWHAAAVF